MKFLALGFVFACLVCTVPLGSAADKTVNSALPSDVAEFKKQRDLCDHFRGEEPYNEERRRFLIENLKRTCTGTDKELSSLKTKYENNSAVLNVLSDYEENIE